MQEQEQDSSYESKEKKKKKRAEDEKKPKYTFEHTEPAGKYNVQLDMTLFHRKARDGE